MKIYNKNSSFINKYRISRLTAGLVISNVLVLFAMLFILLQHPCSAKMNWYYSIAALIGIIVIFIAGFIFVLSYSNNYDKLKKNSKEIEFKNTALTHMFNELKIAKENLYIFSETLERKVLEKTESIKNLLDNAGQGFLTFGIDLLVDENYSLECKTIFNREIESENISELIFPCNAEQQQLLQSVISKVLVEKDLSKREAYLSLLPEEATINNRQIHIKYKIITTNICVPTETVMLILTDITENRMLQTQMEEDRNTMEMIVNIVTNFSDFVDCVHDYNNFCTIRVFEIINTSYSIEDIIIRLYRAIHTFKGSFSQFGLTNISAYLHQFESDLSSLMNNKNNMSLEDMEVFLLDYHMLDWLNEDLCILKNVLGDSFFQNTDIVKIDKQKLLEIENKILSLMSPIDYNLLIPDVRKLRYKPFNELLKPYAGYLLTLSDRLCKQVNPLVIEGGEFYVDPEKYNSFAKSLGHVFRDIIEYGIEPWDERNKSGKSECGNIKCIAELVDNIIKLKISDDGFGVDVNLIKKTAIEKGFYTEEEIRSKSESEVISLIFYDGFSTNCKISDLSGRGIGLSAVKDEIDRLGGSIEVSTSIGLGTQFTFLIPYSSITDLPLISETKFMSSLVDTVKNFFEGQLSFSDTCLGEKVKKVDTLSLRDVSVLIRIKGAINGLFIFSADENLLNSILSYFVLASVKPEDEEISNEDFLAECTNMIMGNLSKFLPDMEDYTNLGTPITFHAQNAKIQPSVSEIWTASLFSDKGCIDIVFLNSL